jgi:putative transposase
MQLLLNPDSCAQEDSAMDYSSLLDVALVDDWHISEDLWEMIAALLPKHQNRHRFGGGRPRTPDRVCMEAILFVLRTGCQWKALNATRFCPGSTAHDRFQEWVNDGVFQRMWEAGLLTYEECKGIDWSWQSMDGCITKAPLGGEKDGQKPYRSRQAGSQAQLVGRRPRHSNRPGSRWRQPQRHENGSRDVGERSRRKTATYA